MSDHLATDSLHAAAGPPRRRARGAKAAWDAFGPALTGARLPQPATTGLRSALWVPLFGDLADPAVVARLAAEAEEARLARGLRLGSPVLAGTGAAGGRPVDHPGGDRHRD